MIFVFLGLRAPWRFIASCNEYRHCTPDNTGDLSDGVAGSLLLSASQDSQNPTATDSTGCVVLS